MMEIADKMESDINLLEAQINAKIAILKEVFADVDSLESNMNRNTIREVFSVEPASSISTPYVINFHLKWSMGFEDYVCLGIDVVNTSSTFDMLPTCHVLASSGVVRSIIFSNDGKCLSSVRLVQWCFGSFKLYIISSSDSSCQLVMAFSKGVFFKKSSATVLIDCRWAQHGTIVPSIVASFACDPTISRTPLVESHSLIIEEPTNWLTMVDLLSSDEKSALRLLRCVRVACYMRSVKSIPQSEFRNRYPTFNCCDFGEWQFFVGSGKMSGLLAYSLYTENCMDTIYSRTYLNVECEYGYLSVIKESSFGDQKKKII
uniref:Transducin/WD40 repeat-like superfamily protein n=1 Tax=Heterorhabditis bacteriophora TaxID=37862 RepID=A0A1I7XTY7_HETBA